MKKNNIKEILDKLELEPVGRFEKNFYIIKIDDSDQYATAYSLLNKNAINTEYPNFEKNSANSLNKVINYFEFEHEGLVYDIFLIADFKNDDYQIKIGER